MLSLSRWFVIILSWPVAVSRNLLLDRLNRLDILNIVISMSFFVIVVRFFFDFVLEDCYFLIITYFFGWTSPSIHFDFFLLVRVLNFTLFKQIVQVVICQSGLLHYL